MPSAIRTGRRNGGRFRSWPSGALIVALAITRLPGDGGHIPAKGLVGRRPLGPGDRAGRGLLAGTGDVGFGLVLGPEAPLIVMGAGLAGR